MPFGASAPPLPAEETGHDPRRVLDELLLMALRRPPCLVAFSGGRDSSALLAAAAQVAAAEGLDAPVPVTARFPGVGTTEEATWQERVVTHLGLGDWERVVITDELDLVGPYARRLSAVHGNLFPFNAHFSGPLAERARGGTLITGVGGDEVFGTTPWPRAARLLEPTAPRRHRLAGRVLDAAPVTVRRRALRDLLDTARPWMLASAERRAVRAFERWTARQPVDRDRALRAWLWPSRYWQLGRRSLDLVGELWGARLCSPFMEPRFLRSAARAMGPSGHPSRAAAMERLLGADLLPEDVLRRRSKATFDLVFFGPHSRAFVESWDGRGLDAELVDADRLRETWLTPPRPDARSYSLLKAAHLAGRRLEPAQPAHPPTSHRPAPGRPDARGLGAR